MTYSLNGNGPAFLLGEHKRLKSWRKLAKRYRLKSGAHAWNVAHARQEITPAVAVLIARKQARQPRRRRIAISLTDPASAAASIRANAGPDFLRELWERERRHWWAISGEWAP